MKTNKILPVVLCGGSGTRLWPLSRSSYPKQFLSLNKNTQNTFLQETIGRLNGLANLSDPLIICNEEHRFIVAEQMRNNNINPKSIILEPFGRNTAPAITIAALRALNYGEDPHLLILSADHFIQNNRKFLEVINAGIKFSNENKIITFGVPPISPETGYGYIEIDKRLNLTTNLKKISTTIGPGSYTSLRVGSAFISGLIISRNIPYYPLSIEDIINFNSTKHSKKNLGVFITSSNNQKFLCYKIKDNEMEYYKIENNKYSIPKHIDFILHNESKINANNELEQMKFSFFEEFYTNYNNFTFKKNIIIEPIYISNNQLLN